METKAEKFPKGFFWGTSTSSHQTEGNNDRNDWWKAEQEGKVPYKSGLACNSYHMFGKDFYLTAGMRNNAHRISIEWSRIEPEMGIFNFAEIEHYREVLRAMRAYGLEPFITLNHFTLPLWLADIGGWTNKKAPRYFARYVRFVAKYLGEEVNYWITSNEPEIVIYFGYLAGSWPPFRKNDIFGFLVSASNLIKAHKRAYKVIHEIKPSAKVGASENIVCFQSEGHWAVNSFFVSILDHTRNYWFFDRIKRCMDFIGINYYTRYIFSVFRGLHRGNGEQGDNGWEIFPAGIYHVVKKINRRYDKLPIFITENGLADAKDDKRSRFLIEHLKWLLKAIKEGVDVKGYFHWSLLDNFEWLQGFTMRFGLINVDFKTLERKIRSSGKLYKEICEKNAFPERGGNENGTNDCAV